MNILKRTIKTNYKKLCSLWGRNCFNREQIRTVKKAWDTKDFQKDILILCHVNIGYGIADFLSPSVCVKCITNISNIKNFSSETTLNKLINSKKEITKIWATFRDSLNEEEYRMCSHSTRSCN